MVYHDNVYTIPYIVYLGGCEIKLVVLVTKQVARPIVGYPIVWAVRECPSCTQVHDKTSPLRL